MALMIPMNSKNRQAYELLKDNVDRVGNALLSALSTATLGWWPSYVNLGKGFKVPTFVEIKKDIEVLVKEGMTLEMATALDLVAWYTDITGKLRLYNCCDTLNSKLNIEFHQSGGLPDYKWGQKYVCIAIKACYNPVSFSGKSDKVAFIEKAMRDASRMQLSMRLVLMADPELCKQAATSSARLAMILAVLAGIFVPNLTNFRAALILRIMHHGKMMEGPENDELETILLTTGVNMIKNRIEDVFRAKKRDIVHQFEEKYREAYMERGLGTIGANFAAICKSAGSCDPEGLDKLQAQFGRIATLTREEFEVDAPDIILLITSIDREFEAGGALSAIFMKKFTSLIREKFSIQPDERIVTPFTGFKFGQMGK